MWGNPTEDAAGTLQLASSRPLRGLPDSIAVKKGDGPRVIENLVVCRHRRHRAHGEGRRPAIGAGQSAAGRQRRAATALLGRPARPERRDHRHGDGGRLFPLCPRQGLCRHGRPPGQRLPDHRRILGRSSTRLPRNSTSPAGSSACPATNGRATPAWAATATSSIAARAGRSAAPRTSWSRAQTSTRRGLHRGQTIRGAGGRGLPWSSPMSADAMPTSNTPMTGARARGRGAFDLGHVRMAAARRVRARAIASAWSATATTTRAVPAPPCPAPRRFGAIGGFSCYFMPELDRDALFEALRRRHHYGTTGTRIVPRRARQLRARRHRLLRRSANSGRRGQATLREAMMGDIIRPGRRADAARRRGRSAPRRWSGSTCCTAPTSCRSARPFAPADLGRRVRVLWQGAEYRGRGRETLWQGQAHGRPATASCALRR